MAKGEGTSSMYDSDDTSYCSGRHAVLARNVRAAPNCLRTKNDRKYRLEYHREAETRVVERVLACRDVQTPLTFNTRLNWWDNLHSRHMILCFLSICVPHQVPRRANIPTERIRDALRSCAAAR